MWLWVKKKSPRVSQGFSLIFPFTFDHSGCWMMLDGFRWPGRLGDIHASRSCKYRLEADQTCQPTPEQCVVWLLLQLQAASMWK